MTRQEIEHMIARREEAQSRRDLDGLSALYLEDAIVESPTAGGTVRGRTAITEIYRTWFQGFPDVGFTTDTVLIDGDRVAWIGESHGTDTGGFLGLPPTKRPFRLRMVILCEMKDGLIARERRIYDFTGMLLQVGILKAKPV